MCYCLFFYFTVAHFAFHHKLSIFIWQYSWSVTQWEAGSVTCCLRCCSGLSKQPAATRKMYIDTGFWSEWEFVFALKDRPVFLMAEHICLMLVKYILYRQANWLGSLNLLAIIKAKHGLECHQINRLHLVKFGAQTNVKHESLNHVLEGMFPQSKHWCWNLNWFEFTE